MKHIKKIKIDIDKKNFEVIPSVQYDSNTRYLHIQLLNDSVPFDITGCSVILSGVKEDGNSIFNSCDIINSEIGFIQAEVTEQMNAIPGYIDCEIKIYNGEGVLTSKKFTIKVTASQTSKKVVSSNEFKALTDALKVVQGIDNKMNKGDTILVSQIDKNKGKFDQTYMSDELLRQITGNAPVNATPEDGGVTTEKLADKSVSFPKMADDIVDILDTKLNKITLKNLVLNPMFLDGVTHWTQLYVKDVITGVDGLTFTPTQQYGQFKFLLGKFDIGDKIYCCATVKTTNSSAKVDIHRGNGDSAIAIGYFRSDDQWETRSVVGKVTEGFETLHVRILNATSDINPISIKGFTVINLTKTFGAGNEPTASEIDTIISSLNDGEYHFISHIISNKIYADIENCLKKDIIKPNHIEKKGPELNAGGNYPLYPMSRDGIVSEAATLLNKLLLDIKVIGAKPGKIYRLAWIGFGYTGFGRTDYGVMIEQFDEVTYKENSSSSKKLLINIGESNEPTPTERIHTKIVDIAEYGIKVLITYDTTIDVPGKYIGLNSSNQHGYSWIIDKSNYIYERSDNTFNGSKLRDSTVDIDKLSNEAINYFDKRYKVNTLFNNLLLDGNMTDRTKWSTAGDVDLIIENNEITLVPKSIHANIRTKIDDIPTTEEDIYYVGCYMNAYYNDVYLSIFDYATSNNFGGGAYYSAPYGEYKIIATRGAVPQGKVFGARVVHSTSDIEHPTKFKKMVALNLTRIFGKGNEPTTEEITNIILKNIGEEFFFDEFIIKDNKETTMGNIKVIAREGEYAKVITPYNTTHDIAVLIQRTGANDICNIKKVSRINKETNGETVMESMGTDWLGPIIFKALNNVDGDQPNSGYFTGGNHAYDNTGDSSKGKTGRTEWIKIYVDGKEVIGTFTGYCNEVKVIYKNLVQAYNTTKADGSGREVLEEMYTIICNQQGLFNVSNMLRALEPLELETYFGMQCTNYSWNEKLLYLSDVNRKWLPVESQANDSSGKTCDKVILKKNGHKLTMSLDRTTGLGINKNINPACHTEKYGKTYFNLLRKGVFTETLDTDEIVSFSGAYHFEFE